MEAGDGDFPRGGGSEPSALEYRTIAAQAARDADTEGPVTGASPKASLKKQKRKSRDATPSRQPKRGKKQSRKSGGLSHKKLAPGMLLLAAVREVHTHHLLLSLPNLLTGVARIGDIVDGHDDEDDASDDDESDLDGANLSEGGPAADVYALPNIYNAGDLVVCSILAIEEKKGSTQIIVSLRPTVINAALSEASLTEGRTVWASVSSKQDHGYTIELGVPGVRAFLPRKAARPYLTAKDRRTLYVGETLHVVVTKSVRRGDVAQVSADPAKVLEATPSNISRFTLGDLSPGLRINTTVMEPTEKDVSLGFAGFEGICDLAHLADTCRGANIAESYPPKTRGEARILYVDVASKRIGLTLREVIVEGFTVDASPVAIGSRFPSCIVRRVDDKVGLLVSASVGEGTDVAAEAFPLEGDELEAENSDDSGNEDEVPSGMDVEVKSRDVYGYVHISRVSDDHVASLNSNLLGTSRRGRVLSYNALDGLLQVSLQDSIYTQSYLRMEDAIAGSVVTATIDEVADFGMLLSVSEFVRALCPPSHLSDVRLKNPGAKFKRGTTIQCRVLSHRMRGSRKRLLVTCRKSLVKSPLPIISMYDASLVGTAAHGVVVSHKPFGTLVQFYNNVRGILPKGSARLDQFPVGQTVKVKVLDCDPSAERMRLTFDLDEDVPTESGKRRSVARGEAVADISPGSRVDVKVVSTKENELEVQLIDRELFSRITTYHLSDHPSLWNLEAAARKPGDVIEGVLVVAKEGPSETLLLSLKPTLLEAAVQDGLPRKASELVPGSFHAGYIRSITSYGCFVGLMHGVVGLIRVADLAKRYVDDPKAEGFVVGQSVHVAVASYDDATDRAHFTLKDVPDHRSLAAEKRWTQAYFEAIDRLKSESAEAEPFASLRHSRKVKARITAIQEVGALADIEGGIQGFVPTYHSVCGAKKRLKLGANVTARVLDVDFQKAVVDLTCRPELLKWDESVEIPNKSVHAVTIVLVKEDHVIVAFPSGKLGFALTTTPNDRRSPFQRYVCGGGAEVQVLGRGSKRLLCKMQKVAAAPGDAAADSDIAALRLVGATFEATIKSIKGTQMNLSIETSGGQSVPGRVHITEFEDTPQHVKSGNKTKPFDGVKVGSRVKVRTIGLHEAKVLHRHLVITSKKTHTIIECTMKPSKLETEDASELPCWTNRDFSVGDEVVGYVQKAESKGVWVMISPQCRGLVPPAQASCDAKVRSSLAKFFPVGARIRCVIQKSPKGTQFLRLAVVGVGKETVHVPKPGTTVTGTIYRKVDKDGLWIQLPSKVQGRVFLTNTSDKLSKFPLSKFEVGAKIKCYVIGPLQRNRTESRKDKKSKTVQLELSLRKSQIHGVGAIADAIIATIDDVKPDGVHTGYVINTTDNGCFVALGPSVVGRVQIGNLSDLFIKDFRASFTPGMRVRARVLSVDPKSERVELTLKPSVVDPDKHAAPITLADLKEGEKLKATVKRVESYGVFVTLDNSSLVGLCHISEVSNDFVANLTEVFSAGDRVKVLVLKIDAETNKISLSLKAEHFEGDVDSDDDEVGEAEEDELKEDAASGEDSEDSEDGDNSDNGDGDEDDDGEDESESLFADASAAAAMDSDEDLGEVIHSTRTVVPDELGQSARKRKFADVPALRVGGGFFDDMEEGDNIASSDDESSDDDQEETTSKKKSKRAKRMEKRVEEEEIALKERELLENGDEPESAADFDRLLLGEPNNSFLWVKYMAFHLQMTEIDKARAVAERALKAISVREEDERMNVWIAKLNLENNYGSDETLASTFDEAQRMNDSLKTHLHMASILERSDKVDKADEHYQIMCRRFKSELKVWVNYGGFKMRIGKTEQARMVLQQSLKSLPKHEHVTAVTKFALLDFKNGEVDRGRTLFENLLSNYPKRIDLWNVYIDQELRVGDQPAIRALFERVTAMSLSSKKMKFFFKRYLEYEKTEGDDDTVEHVMQRAREYIESKMA